MLGAAMQETNDMISILFPSTLSIEASCSQGIILGGTESDLMLSEFRFWWPAQGHKQQQSRLVTNLFHKGKMIWKMATLNFN